MVASGPGLCNNTDERTHRGVKGATLETMEDAVRSLLGELGEDITREGLVDTPRRVAKAWLDMADGGGLECAGAFGQARFNEALLSARTDGVVLVRDVTFAALSEATLLPFHGRCHIAYVPQNGVVLGLSKLARVTRCLASRLQRQDRLTCDLLAAVQAQVGSKGVAVVVRATHVGRGTSVPAARISVASCGCFEEEPGMLEEVFLLLGLGLPPHPAVAAVELSCSSSLAAPSCMLAVEALRLEAADEGAPLAAAANPKIASAVEALLGGLGEDPQRAGLQGSAQRYARWLTAATAGYRMQLPVAMAEGPPTPGDQSPDEASDTSSDDMSAELADGPCCFNLRHRDQEELARPPQGVAVHGAARGGGVYVTRFMSQCEHHLLPFYGTLRLAYSPTGGVAGGGSSCAGQLPAAALDHIVTMFSRRLQVQERLTQQVADAAEALLGGGNVLVVCESAHMCMVARGVEEHASTTLTTAARGGWAVSAAARRSAMELLLPLTAPT